MYSWNYGQNTTRRLVNVFRPTIGHPYQILNQPGASNTDGRTFGYYIVNDFGEFVPVKSWVFSPAYQDQ